MLIPEVLLIQVANDEERVVCQRTWGPKGQASDLHDTSFWNRVPGCNYPGTCYPVSTRAQDINYDSRGGEGVDGWVSNQRPLSLYYPMVANLNLQFCEYGLASSLCCFS